MSSTAPAQSVPEKPSALGVDPDGLPRDLDEYEQFVAWDWEWRAKGGGAAAWTKPPLRVRGIGYAKSTDDEGWGSRRAALRAYRERGLAGIGFALTADDPFAFVDLDRCRDALTGEIASWAEPILSRFAGTYQEISPSGTGIKILLRGHLPGPQHVYRVPELNGAKVELFDRAKYTTLTGHRLPSASPRIADGQRDLDELYRELFGAEKPKPPAARPEPPGAPGDADDDVRLAKARGAKRGAEFIRLFDVGDTAAYGNDHSGGDLALCGMLAFWFGPDRSRIDGVFRRSALMRPKWDEVHHGDGRTYGEGTIDKALAGMTDFYTPRARHLSVVGGGDPGAAQHRTRWTATELLGESLPAVHWAVPDFLPEGLTVLAGRPKKGKSRLALCLAVSVAGGIPALGYFVVDHPGDVLFVGMEDGPRRLQERIQDILGDEEPSERLHLWIDLPKLGEGCEETLERWLAEHPNARMIVLDTYQRLRKPPTGREGNSYAVDYEDAARLQRIAQRHRVAIVLICHTRKPVGGGDPFDDVMGTTGNTASADALMILQTERGKADAKLLVTGRDVEDSEHALASDAATGRWGRLGDAADVRRSFQRESILGALRAAGPKGMRPFEIAAATNQRGPNVRYLLYRMLQDNEVGEVEGRYVNMVFSKTLPPLVIRGRQERLSDFGEADDDALRAGVARVPLSRVPLTREDTHTIPNATAQNPDTYAENEQIRGVRGPLVSALGDEATGPNAEGGALRHQESPNVRGVRGESGERGVGNESRVSGRRRSLAQERGSWWCDCGTSVRVGWRCPTCGKEEEKE